MKKWKWVNGLMLASVCAGGSLQGGMIDNLLASLTKTAEPADPIVGVLIAHDVPGVVLEVTGKYRIFDPLTQEFISTRYIGKRKFVQAVSNGIKWGEEFPTIYQIQIVPEDAKTSVLVDGIEYKGLITVYDIGGSISIVNDIALDEYVKTVLNPLYSSDIPEELAAAIVIAERSNALNQIKNAPSRYFAVDLENVNYQGGAALTRGEGFDSAIQATKNMVMIKDDAPVAVNLFAANKGGDTFKPSLGKLSFDQAVDLAKRGNHAAQILAQGFPGSSIRLINSL